MTTTDVLSAAEAGERLGLSASTIYECVRRGDVPNVAPPGLRKVRIPRLWVDERLAGGSDAGGITPAVIDRLDRIERLLEVVVGGLGAAGDVARAWLAERE